MDAKPSDRSFGCRRALCGSHLWRAVRDAEQGTVEPEGPHGALESLAERFFVDRDVPNAAAARPQPVSR